MINPEGFVCLSVTPPGLCVFMYLRVYVYEITLRVLRAKDCIDREYGG